MKQCVKCSLLSVREDIDNRKNSFEFFGYDFMIDQDLRVWLIEVNASPSMEQSTTVTEELVNNVLTDLPKVIIDFAYYWKSNTGGFEQVHYGKKTDLSMKKQDVDLVNFAI